MGSARRRLARTFGVALALVAVASGVGLAPAPGTASHLVPGAGAPDGGPPLPPAPAASPVGHLRAWTGIPGDVAGHLTYSRGELIVTDHPFDDRGADTDGNDGRSLNPGEYDTLLKGANAALGASGDYAYPSDPGYARNAADIVEVRVALDADAWYLLVVLNALLDPERTGIEARVDGAHTLLVHGQSATLDGTAVTASADAEQNTFEARVPRALLDLGAGSHEIFVAAGLWDAGTWVDPDPSAPGAPYFDLAYVPNEGMDSYWREVEQSRDIAAGTFAGDAFDVDSECLLAEACGIANAGTEPFTRVFRSGQPLGEGVSLQTRYGQETSGFGWNLYRSRYQPYAIYVPDRTVNRPQPLVLLLHFLGGNYMSYPLISWPNLKAWADALGAIVAMPLARGEAGWYEGEAEKDVFEVWRDVAQHYDVDRDRVYLTGMSMGGFGTWRLGTLYPDQFAKAIVWSGPVTPYSIWPAPAPVTTPYPNPPMCERDAPGCGYTLIDLFGNARNLPYLVVHGGADELVPSTGPEEWMRGVDASHWQPYRYVLYPGRRHETTYPGSTAHWVTEWLGDLPKRNPAPVYVSYRILRDLLQPQFGIAYDRAYWLGDLTLDDGASEGLIVGDRQDTLARSVPIEARFGVDGLGPYRVSGRDVYEGVPSRDSVYVIERGLSTAAVDTARLGWDLSAPVFVRGDAGDAFDLRLDGAFAAVLTLTGAAYDRDGMDVVLHIPAGTFNVKIAPA